MLQEIEPRHLDNQYRPRPLGPGAKICVFQNQEILVSRREDELRLPDWEQLAGGIRRSVYLFSVDDTPYFLARESTRKSERKVCEDYIQIFFR